MEVRERLVPGQFYHLYNEGNNKDILFAEGRNYPYFLSLWQRHVSMVAETYAYVLLKDDFHFLIRTRELGSLTINDDTRGSVGSVSYYLSQRLSNFFNAYAKSFNKAYARSGSLFRERFRRTLIDESCLQDLVVYIHDRPEKLGYVTDFSNYEHSSFWSLLHGTDDGLRSEKVWALFGGKDKFLEYHGRVAK